MCESPAVLDSTGAIECYGHCWQTESITCTAVNDKHCTMSLDLTADFYNLRNSADVLVEAWNKLGRKND